MLCEPCRTLRTRWLDTRPPRNVLITNHGPYTGDEPAIKQDRWAATVRRQRALIAELCRANHQGRV